MPSDSGDEARYLLVAGLGIHHLLLCEPGRKATHYSLAQTQPRAEDRNSSESTVGVVSSLEPRQRAVVAGQSKGSS